MRKLILSVAVGALAVSGMALADGKNWDPEKAAQVAVNRCANAGPGNGSELLRDDCTKNPDGSDAGKDWDPGKSYEHNANNTK